MANLVFKDCTFDSTTENGTIVEVEGCPLSTSIEATVRLYHVIFERNVLVGGAGLRMNTPSCAMLELKDFTFKNNTCSGRCGVILSSWNQLRDVRVQHVRVSTAKTFKSVFYAPPESTSLIKRMSAAENDCPILHVDGGTLNVSDSSFAENEIVNPSGSDDASCIHLMNATVLLEDSQFLKNRAERGCAITAQRSNLTISNCAFEENKAKKAGVIHLTASNASIQSCNFSSNQARRSAGVLMALESQIGIADSSFEANTAGHDGGCFHLQSASTIELIYSTLFGNGARNGGVAFLDERSVGNVLDSSFINNSASSSGGSFCTEDSRLSIQNGRFSGESAGNGGGIYAVSSKISVTETIESSLSLEGDSVCRPCLENRNGETRMILPKKGYWHTPCSVHIDRCIAHDACVGQHPQQELAEATKEVETCDIDKQFFTYYTEAQCREVRQWVLFVDLNSEASVCRDMRVLSADHAENPMENLTLIFARSVYRIPAMSSWSVCLSLSC